MILRSPSYRASVFATLIGLSVPVHGAGLKDVYHTALQYDPVYLAETHKKLASEEVLNQAWARWLPQVSGSIQRSETEQNIIQSDNTVFASGRTNFPTTDYRLEIRQTLINYAQFVSIGQADATVKRFAAEFVAAEQELMKKVAERYFSVLAANESVEYIEAEKTSVQEQFDLVEAKLDQGLVNTVDYQDAQARLLQVTSREIELDNAFVNSKADLRAVIGTLPDGLSLLSENIPLISPSPGKPEEWVTSAYDQNPMIVAKRFEVQEAKKEIEVQRSGHFPTVDVIASYNKSDTGGTLFGGGSEVDTAQVMLELNVPIFDGGGTTSRYRESVQLHSKVTEELRAMMREVERNIITAFNGVNNAIAKVEGLKKLVEASESAVRLKSSAYKSGLASTLDVLDAERNLFFARSEYARARYEYVINTILLRKAAGLLEESDISNIDKSMLTSGDVLPLY